MKTKLLLLLLPALALAFTSCKKCYECKKPEYCLSCVGTVGEFTTPVSDCYGSTEERATAREAIESGFEFAGGSVYCLETTANDQGVEFCENKKNRDAELEQWEALGYTCTAK